LKQPFSAYRPGRMDELVLGMVNQVSQAMDEAVTSEVIIAILCTLQVLVFLFLGNTTSI
jgi:hypothetical protein